MAILNAVCLKYGTLYGPEYVNRLYRAICRNTVSEVRFFCMTDDRRGILPSVEFLPLPEESFQKRMEEAQARAPQKHGRLKKISMFRPDLYSDIDGPLMVFDLDVVITGNLDEIRDYAPGKVCMRREWHATPQNGKLGHGSVERFDPRLHGYLYEFMARDPEAGVELGRGSEQTYTSRCAEARGDFEAFPEEWIVSFKYDCRPMRPLNLLLEPRLPRGAKVICFHGNPKMEQAVEGYRADPLHSTRPCHWLRDAWIGPEGQEVA